MQPDKINRNYQILELQGNESLEQVEASYRRLLRRYGPGCLASYGLLRVGDRGAFLTGLKHAYQQLMQHSSSPPDSFDDTGHPFAGSNDDLASWQAYLQNHPGLQAEAAEAMNQHKLTNVS